MLKALADFRRENSRNFCQTDIGFVTNKPIFLHESLTPHYRGIFRLANKLKHQKHIFSAYSMRGVVYIRRRKQDNPLKIDSIDQLNDIAHVHQLTEDGDLQTVAAEVQSSSK